MHNNNWHDTFVTVKAIKLGMEQCIIQLPHITALRWTFMVMLFIRKVHCVYLSFKTFITILIHFIRITRPFLQGRRKDFDIGAASVKDNAISHC